MRVILIRLIGFLVLSGCGYSSTDVPMGSPQVNGGTPEKPTELSYAQMHAQVFKPYCLRCHSNAGGNRAGVNLENYNNIKEIASAINGAVSSGQMPPSGSMPVSVRDLLLRWLAAGAPETGQSHLPDPSAPITSPAPSPIDPPTPCEDQREEFRRRQEKGFIIAIDQKVYYDVLSQSLKSRRGDCEDDQ